MRSLPGLLRSFSFLSLGTLSTLHTIRCERPPCRGSHRWWLSGKREHRDQSKVISLPGPASRGIHPGPRAWSVGKVKGPPFTTQAKTTKANQEIISAQWPSVCAQQVRVVFLLLRRARKTHFMRRFDGMHAHTHTHLLFLRRPQRRTYIFAYCPKGKTRVPTVT